MCQSRSALLAKGSKPPPQEMPGEQRIGQVQGDNAHGYTRLSDDIDAIEAVPCWQMCVPALVGSSTHSASAASRARPELHRERDQTIAAPDSSSRRYSGLLCVRAMPQQWRPHDDAEWQQSATHLRAEDIRCTTKSMRSDCQLCTACPRFPHVYLLLLIFHGGGPQSDHRSE